MKECCWPWQGFDPRPSGLQSDGASNWATEAGIHAVWSVFVVYMRKMHPCLSKMLIKSLIRLCWSESSLGARVRRYNFLSCRSYCNNPICWNIGLNKQCTSWYLGPVVQSIVSLSSSLVVKMLTVQVSTIPKSQVFFAEKMWVAFANAKAAHIFWAKILAYRPYFMIKVLTIC